MPNKLPWDIYPHIWKTKSAFMAWIRGGIRRSLWSRSPIKLEFIKKNRILIENPSKARKNKTHVFGAVCVFCGKQHPLKNIEVDHKSGNNSLREVDDIGPFIMSIVMVTEDDLQLVCKDCHKIKTHAEKNSISFYGAMRAKKIIAYMKLSTDKQIEILSAHDKPYKNTKERKQSFYDIIDALEVI